MSELITISEALATTTDQLTTYLKNPTNAQQEACWLLAHILDCDITFLYSHPNSTLTQKQSTELKKAICERIEDHKPLAYILGCAPFGPFSVYHTRPPVLIPRPETEEIQEWLVAQIKKHAPEKPLAILDLCTGSGCIALALAYQLPHATITGVDICKEAYAVAQENKQRIGLGNVTFLTSDLFEAVAGKKFDIIISNPPYLSHTEWNELSDDVKAWEAAHALKADNNGLALYERIIAQAHTYLKKPQDNLPSLVLEIGHTQKKAVTTLLRDNRFLNILCHQDLSGKDRWISSQAYCS